MKIGIDIDGVLLNSEREFRFAAEMYDTSVLKRNSVKNIEEPRVQQRYNWSEAENNEFFKRYLYEYALKANVMPGAKEVTDFLKSQGHELIVITARGHFEPKMKEEAESKLKNAGIIIDKFYFFVDDKVEICKKENIDYMIDDFYQICKDVSDSGINAIYLRDTGMKSLKENEHLMQVSSWGEIFRFFYNLNK